MSPPHAKKRLKSPLPRCWPPSGKRRSAPWPKFYSSILRQIHVPGCKLLTPRQISIPKPELTFTRVPSVTPCNTDETKPVPPAESKGICAVMECFRFWQPTVTCNWRLCCTTMFGGSSEALCWSSACYGRSRNSESVLSLFSR